MLSAHLATDQDFENVDPMPLLCAATDRLRRYASQDHWPADANASRLLDEAMTAAAEAEQCIAMQRARIRYLESLSITDELTGVLNRRGFEQELARALARAERQGESGLLLLCDLDRFKAINDSYGHVAGDAVLKEMADLFRSTTRCSDYVARLGGDEFALLFTMTDGARARERCAQLEAKTNNRILVWRRHRIPVTASFGMAPYGPGTQRDSLMLLADRDLYAGKGVTGLLDEAKRA